GGLNGDLHVVTAQVLLGGAHRRFLLDGPRLPARGVRQQNALAADTGGGDLAAVDTIEDVADRHTRLVPYRVGAGVPEEPWAADDGQDQDPECGHDHPLAAEGRRERETAKESFHLVPQPLSLVRDWLVG